MFHYRIRIHCSPTYLPATLLAVKAQRDHAGRRKTERLLSRQESIWKDSAQLPVSEPRPSFRLSHLGNLNTPFLSTPVFLCWKLSIWVFTCRLLVLYLQHHKLTLPVLQESCLSFCLNHPEKPKWPLHLLLSSGGLAAVRQASRQAMQARVKTALY